VTGRPKRDVLVGFTFPAVSATFLIPGWFLQKQTPLYEMVIHDLCEPHTQNILKIQYFGSMLVTMSYWVMVMKSSLSVARSYSRGLVTP
jgi:hypothetical protein